MLSLSCMTTSLLPHEQDRQVIGIGGGGEQAQAIRRRVVSVIMAHPAKLRYCRGLPMPCPPGSSNLQEETKKASIESHEKQAFRFEHHTMRHIKTTSDITSLFHQNCILARMGQTLEGTEEGTVLN